MADPRLAEGLALSRVTTLLAALENKDYVVSCATLGFFLDPLYCSDALPFLLQGLSFEWIVKSVAAAGDGAVVGVRMTAPGGKGVKKDYMIYLYRYRDFGWQIVNIG